jgi:hypothetical protein
MRTVVFKISLFKISALAILASCAEFSQNSDLGIMAGSTGRTSEALPGGNQRVQGAWPWVTQFSYAWQVRDTPAGHLYVEVVLINGSNGSNVISSNLSTPGRTWIFFAPGVRFKIPVRSRLSTYTAVGVGVASFGVGDVPLDSVIIPSRTSSGTVDFGGGMDFRLTRLLSLRGEARDFVTRPGLGGYQGRNHPALQLGIGFHF